MKDYSDFRADLEYGEEGENILNGVLRNQKIEVKRDRIAHRTGNYYFEYESHGKPSGFKTTTAGLWAIMTADCSTTLLVETTRLVESLRKFKAQCIATEQDAAETWAKRGGDGNTSVGVLIPADILIHQILSHCQDR